MSNTQTFEGPHLEPLLAKVRDAHGAHARIVSVDKVRSGGMGGFFQRERFEVVVETDGDTTTTTGLPAPAPMAAPMTAPMTAPAAAAPVVAPVIGPAPTSIFDLAAAVDDGFADGTGTENGEPAAAVSTGLMGEPAAAVSTTQPEFEAIMARVSATLGSIPTPATPENIAAASAEATVDAAPAEFAPPASTPPATTAPATTPAPVASAPSPLPLPPTPAVDTQLEEPAPPMLKWTPETARAAASVPATQAGRDLTPAADAPVGPDAGHRAVVALGLPAAFVPPASTPVHDLRRALTQRLERLPAAPGLPREGGAVIAVVGEVDDAFAHGLRLATELGIEDDGVVLATRNEPMSLSSRLHVRGVSDANTRRRAWYRRNLPVVVAIDAPVVPDRDTWVADVLAALEPTLVIGAVDARRKTEDVLEWGRGFGGVDAVILENLQATVSPGAMLSLGVPVMAIDGLPATPARWVDSLTRRLTAVAA